MSFRFCIVVIGSFFCSQQILGSQSSILNAFMQPHVQKKGSWNPHLPARILTQEEVQTIRENLDTQKSKVCYGESQNSENRDQKLLTVTLLCAYHEISENKRDRYPRLMFGVLPQQTISACLNNDEL